MSSTYNEITELQYFMRDQGWTVTHKGEDVSASAIPMIAGFVLGSQYNVLKDQRKALQEPNPNCAICNGTGKTLGIHGEGACPCTAS